MDIITEYKTRYHNDLLAAARILDYEATASIETEWKSLWDSGENFVGITFPGTKRDADSEDQIDGFCRGFDNDLRKLVLDRWVRKYDRDQVVALLNLLLAAPNRQGTRITLAGDYSVTLDDVRLKWNDQNPDAPIHPIPAIEI